MIKLLQVIHRMENLDVMYRDLKPDNFKLLENNTYCFIDFGHSIQLPKAIYPDGTSDEAISDEAENGPRYRITASSYDL